MALLPKKYGSMVFLAGFILAAINGFVTIVPAWVIVIIGLLVGYMNIGAGESVKAILAALAIGGGATLMADVPTIGAMGSTILMNIGVFALSAVLIPAILVFYKTAKK